MTSGTETERWDTYDTTYNLTTTTFEKTSRLPQIVDGIDGSNFTWFRAWNHERITNEANALLLISQNTTIPVPRLISTGIYPDGRRYLVTERISGVNLSSLSSCTLPDGQKHTDEKRCKPCVEKAYSNAVKFVEDTVLPQLANLKSLERGLRGFVMPPRWATADFPPWKGGGPWKTLRLEEPKYIFQHGDLAAQNIIIDPESLQVKGLIDWEYAGFFPPGMEIWNGTLNRHGDGGNCLSKANAIAKFLADEYLDCYNRWEDKAGLVKRIKRGEIPRLEQLELDSGGKEKDCKGDC